MASKRATVLTATLTFGAASLAIGFLPPLPVILVLSAVVGLVYGPIGPIYNSVMQTRTPEHMRGRVVGVMTSMAYAAGPVGFMLAGPLVDAFGLTPAFLALALPLLVIALLCPWIPALRELDRPATA
jgi:MFS family permease